MPTITPTQAVTAEVWTPVTSAAANLLIAAAPRVTITGTGTIGVRLKAADGRVLHESVGPSPQVAGHNAATASVEVKAATNQTISLSVVT